VYIFEFAKNFEIVVKILLDNGYPLKFIFQTFHTRLKFLFNNQTHNKSVNPTEEASSYFTIPYVPHISESFKNLTKDLDVKISYFSLNKMRNYIKTHKDVRPKTTHSNVVYKINCNNCDASYVGQTSRQLHTRMSEHKKHIRRNTTSRSVITDHRLDLNHDFNWNDVEILDNEPYLNKRLISEMLFIKWQKTA